MRELVAEEAGRDARRHNDVRRAVDDRFVRPVVLVYQAVLAAMAHDRYKMGRVHPVYWIGVAVMAVALARVPFGQTELWRGIGRAMLSPLLLTTHGTS